MRKLIEQKWALGKDTVVTFESYMGEEGATVLIRQGKKELSFNGEEARGLKEIFENTNYIFEAENGMPEITAAGTMEYNWKEKL